MPLYYTAYGVIHVNAHSQSLGHLEKLFFQFTSFFWCALICLLVSPSDVWFSKCAHGI